MSGNIRQNLSRPSIWLRLVFMIILAIAFNIAELVMIAVVVLQFLTALFTRKPNTHLSHFGSTLARYLQQIVSYLTFASEEKPFPFSAWPSETSNGSIPKDDTETSKKRPEKIEPSQEVEKKASKLSMKK